MSTKFIKDILNNIGYLPKKDSPFQKKELSATFQIQKGVPVCKKVDLEFDIDESKKVHLEGTFMNKMQNHVILIFDGT